MRYVWVVTGRSVHRDEPNEYGPFVFAANPSEALLAQIAQERCDWGDGRGPGSFGSYVDLWVDKVVVE